MLAAYMDLDEDYGPETYHMDLGTSLVAVVDRMDPAEEGSEILEAVTLVFCLHSPATVVDLHKETTCFEEATLVDLHKETTYFEEATSVDLHKETYYFDEAT